MTSQGSAYSRFQRAIATRDPLQAWTAAIDVGRLDLVDALGLVLAMHGDARYSRVAARWVTRFGEEAHDVTLTTLRDLVDVLEDPDGIDRDALLELATTHRLVDVAGRLAHGPAPWRGTDQRSRPSTD